MKENSQQILQKSKKKKDYEQLYAKNFEMDNFLEMYSSAKLNQERDQLNRPIARN